METPPDRDPDDDPKTVDDWLRHALAESMFWPVLVVLALAGTTLGAGILLYGLVERNLAVLAALAILAAMSVDIVVREVRSRGFGIRSRLVAGWWIASAVAAAAAIGLGLA